MAHRPPQPQPGTQCAHGFCPVPIRILWPIKAIRVATIASILRVTDSVIWRRSEMLGVYDQRPRRRVVKVSQPAFAALWADRSLSLTDIGQRIGGLHPVNVGMLGRRLGLPPRIGGRKPRFSFGPEFEAMWRAGVKSREIARFYGCCQPRISREVVQRGLDQRLAQKGRKGITLAEFLETEIARAMVRSAAATADALRAEGRTLLEMAAILGVSRSALQSDIRALDLVGTSAYAADRGWPGARDPAERRAA